MSTKYLYGLSVQGIQEFIFKTNKLREIIGASDIIDSLHSVQNCNDKSLLNIFKKLDIAIDKILLNAAGNFRAIVVGKSNLEKIVLNLPKIIMQNAYGITVSQAVVEFPGDKSYSEISNELEKRLKIQRNKPSLPLDMYINIMKLSPKTARPAYLVKNKDFIDISSSQKLEQYDKWFNIKRSENENFQEYKELSNIANDKNKIAVIHADGNGLGVIVKKLKDLVGSNLNLILDFSQKLDEATKNAFKQAVDESIKNINNTIKKDSEKIEFGKIRSLILSGDDMTAVCDADIALEFTKLFICKFEKNTENFMKNIFGKNVDFPLKLTMCAGIAYCNSKYPFHYAVNLAETLCAESKKHSKNKYCKSGSDIAPSCLMFHNIQGSNFQRWSLTVEKELKIKNKYCDFGPYYLSQDNEALISHFIDLVKNYKNDDSPKSKLRQWLKELGINEEYAKNMLNRINDMILSGLKKDLDESLGKLYKGLSCEDLLINKDEKCKTPIYDVLQILSVTKKGLN